ncbi:condensation domain-containing protein [Lactobacillus sp. ESL0684]|uniref:condensation domain-containing protein n=1 Tax=Lactobacillus sp. ESL0684 TaxID=2983213 RepID=UPI0023F95A1B|nr:condensation domain-containing protein [Lactobacillus sp. ESL0684]WEV43591.1 condensation domain-containing protein [Lactobacillus sp. ESL0684]
MTIYMGEPLNINHTIGLDTLYPVIRCEIQFESILDRQRFIEAVGAVVKIVPELLCRYQVNTNSFEQVTTNCNDLIKYNVVDPDLDAENWDLMLEPQIRIYWNDRNGQTNLIIYFSHILTDGAGSKQILYLLAMAYSEGPDVLKNVHNYQNIDWLEEMLQDYQPSSVRSDHPTKPLSLPQLAKEGKQHYCVGNVCLSQKNTDRLFRASHIAKVTVNDIVMAAFGHVVQRFSGNDTISFACPADMRKFGPKVAGVQVANLTSRYNLSISTSPEESFERLVEHVHQKMLELKHEYQCFDSIKALLDNYKDQPLTKLQEIVQANYHIREIGYTNFGILDSGKLAFTGNKIKRVILTGGFRIAPMFQIAAVTYQQQLHLSFNMIGTESEYAVGLALTQSVADLINNFSLNVLFD